MKKNIIKGKHEMRLLCRKIKKLIKSQDFYQCEKLILAAMEKYPHSPVPHNLLGVILEYQGDSLNAIKHFRAAWALDPSYIPAKFNLEYYEDSLRNNHFAIDEHDCVHEITFEI